MADYYTNFSVIVVLPSPEAQQQALEIAAQAGEAKLGEALPETFPPALKEVVEEWDFETEPTQEGNQPALWLHSQYGGIDAVCAFLQHLLATFDPAGRVSFEWSHDCSKPRTDAYGGGAAIISAWGVTTMTTSQWLAEQLALRDQTPPRGHVFSIETQRCLHCGRDADDELNEPQPCTSETNPTRKEPWATAVTCK